MGKYEKWLPKMLDENFNEDEFKFNALFAIANELAEGNRLKRFELNKGRLRDNKIEDQA